MLINRIAAYCQLIRRGGLRTDDCRLFPQLFFLSLLTFFFSRFIPLYFSMKKSISVILKTFGVIFISIAVLFAWASFNSFMERINHGSGLMFADAEIFLVLMLIFLIAGILCFWIEKKLYDPKKIK